MGVVDTAKNIKTHLVDRFLPQRFVFHHIPKCGGTSVGRALRKRYILSQTTVTPESSFRAFEAFSGRADREQMLVDVLDLREQMLLYHMFEDVRGISLHVRFSESAYSHFRDKYKFITVLRDPVKRFISHYHWSFGKPNAHAHIEEAFEEFLTTDRARRLGATYVEFLSGLPKEADVTSDEAIGAACRNLSRFDVVGNIDQLSSFERDLATELGVKVSIGHENARGRRGSMPNDLQDRRILEMVTELCRPDLAVWRAFVRLQNQKSTK